MGRRHRFCNRLAVNDKGNDRGDHFRDPKRIPDANRSEKPAEYLDIPFPTVVWRRLRYDRIVAEWEHKKNPDVFELTRVKCNKLQSLPQQIMMIANNLPSGYFRDLQIIKEVFLPAFQELKDCLQMTTYIMNEIKVNEHILDDDKYLLIFSVEEVNRLAREGMPFRDAYKKVGLDKIGRASCRERV